MIRQKLGIGEAKRRGGVGRTEEGAKQIIPEEVGRLGRRGKASQFVGDFPDGDRC